MLSKIGILYLIIFMVSCKNEIDTEKLFNYILDDQFLFNSMICSFTTYEIVSDSSKNIWNNSCSELSKQSHNVVNESLNKILILKRGNSFIDSTIIANIKLYLSEDLPSFASLSSSYKYSNRNMFKGYMVIKQDELFSCQEIENNCFVEITDVYYSSDMKLATLGLINYCVDRELYQIYYFRKVRDAWMIYFVQEGDRK